MVKQLAFVAVAVVFLGGCVGHGFHGRTETRTRVEASASTPVTSRSSVSGVERRLQQAPPPQAPALKQPIAPQNQTRTECDWEGVMSLWCGNLLEKADELAKRGVTLKLPHKESAFFFKKSPNISLATLLKGIKTGDKSLLPEDMEAFAQELRANGFPVPSSEGRSARVALTEFFEKNRFREVPCTPVVMQKYGMSYNNKTRTKIEGYYQRHCAPGEMILELCVPREVTAEAPPTSRLVPPHTLTTGGCEQLQVGVPPPTVVTLVPQGCSTLEIQFHVWNGQSLPDSVKEQIMRVTELEKKGTGWNGPSVSRVMGKKLREEIGDAGLVRSAHQVHVKFEESSGNWRELPQLVTSGGKATLQVPPEALGKPMTAIFSGDIISPPHNPPNATLKMAPGELRPPTGQHCVRAAHAVTRF